MKALALHLFAFFAHLGGWGLILLGAMDSSFLFLPLGNDLLLVGLTAAQPSRLWYYAAMATVGSLLGCALLDVVSRKGGEVGLSKLLPERRIEYIRKRMEKRAGWMVAAAAMLPPPFPFTPFVAGAAAFEYPRTRLFGILAPVRLARFMVVALLAAWFGRRILGWAKSPVLHGFLIGLAVVSVAGSAYSVWRLVKNSRSAKR